MKRQVRTQRECDQTRGTHQLETVGGVTNQDKERQQTSEGYSHSEDQREGQVRKQKESDQVRDTHQLETAEGVASQYMERK